jgi:hypothetical protein
MEESELILFITTHHLSRTPEAIPKTTTAGLFFFSKKVAQETRQKNETKKKKKKKKKLGPPATDLAHDPENSLYNEAQLNRLHSVGWLIARSTSAARKVGKSTVKGAIAFLSLIGFPIFQALYVRAGEIIVKKKKKKKKNNSNFNLKKLKKVDNGDEGRLSAVVTKRATPAEKGVPEGGDMRSVRTRENLHQPDKDIEMAATATDMRRRGYDVSAIKKSLRDIGRSTHDHICSALVYCGRGGDHLEMNEVTIIMSELITKQQMLHRDRQVTPGEMALTAEHSTEPMSLSVLINLQGEGFWFHFVRGSHRMTDEMLAGTQEERVWVPAGHMLIFSQLLVHAGGSSQGATTQRLRLHVSLDSTLNPQNRILNSTAYVDTAGIIPI